MSRVSVFYRWLKILFLPALSGLLLVLSFPTYDIYPLAWIAFVPLFFSMRGKSPKPFLKGYIAGIVFFLGTINWVLNSIRLYGGVSLIPALLILLMLCLYLSLYFGAFCSFVWALWRRSSLPTLFLASLVWLPLEYLRSYALTGFPWALLGYSQYKFLPAIQISDLTGVYGISFLVMAVNGAFFDLLSLKKRLEERPLLHLSPTIIGLIILIAGLGFTFIYGILKLRTPETGQSVRISVIQGNIEQDKKWDAKLRRAVLEIYKELTLQAKASSPAFIVWPETAIPFIMSYEHLLTEDLLEFQKSTDTPILAGSVLVKKATKKGYLLTNSAVLLKDGRVDGIYDKIHLVPYGEYVPLKSIFPFIAKMVHGIGDYVPGTTYSVLNAGNSRFAALICYEVIFPGLVRKFPAKGANLLLSITNDAWFGKSAAPYQHFSMAVFRAVENRQPIARAANTGISGFIDSKGRILQQSSIFKKAVMTKELRLGAQKSFYTKYGDLFSFVCIVTAIVITVNFLPRRRYDY